MCAARHAIDPNSKAKNEAELIKALDFPDVTVEQAVKGMELLEKWGSEEILPCKGRWQSAGLTEGCPFVRMARGGRPRRGARPPPPPPGGGCRNTLLMTFKEYWKRKYR